MKRKSTANNVPTVLRAIRQECRSIIRQFSQMLKPHSSFIEVIGRRTPRFYVALSARRPPDIDGLRIGTKKLALPDEYIEDAAYQLASSIWHIKDHLKRWTKMMMPQVDVEHEAEQCKPLLICADLTNRKKHGGDGSRSGLNPRVDLVEFDLSQSGVIELFYDGALKNKELFVEHPVPIDYRVRLMSDDPNDSDMNVLDILKKAFAGWLPLLSNVLVGDEHEVVRLRELIEQFHHL